MYDTVEFGNGDTLESTLAWSAATAPYSADPYSDSGSDVTLEHSAGTNFSCCGLTIPDMHELLNHLEHTHGVAPREALAPTPFLDPTPAPIRAALLASPLHRSHTPLPRHPLPTLVHSPSSMYDSDASLPTPADLTDLPFIDFPRSPSPPQQALPPASFSSPVKKPRSSTSTPRRRGSTKRKLRSSTQSSAVASTSAAQAISSSATSPRRSHDSRRPFRCPNSECIKSYTSEAGLKYHIEKGTCEL